MKFIFTNFYTGETRALETGKTVRFQMLLRVRFFTPLPDGSLSVSVDADPQDLTFTEHRNEIYISLK